jgi:hypothetical protein
MLRSGGANKEKNDFMILNKSVFDYLKEVNDIKLGYTWAFPAIFRLVGFFAP